MRNVKTAGDIAFSNNHSEAYTALLNEGIRAEVLKAHLNMDEDEDWEDEEMESDEAQAKDSASDNKTFLKSRLKFIEHDGQEICVDAEGEFFLSLVRIEVTAD